MCQWHRAGAAVLALPAADTHERSCLAHGDPWDTQGHTGTPCQLMVPACSLPSAGCEEEEEEEKVGDKEAVWHVGRAARCARGLRPADFSCLLALGPVRAAGTCGRLCWPARATGLAALLAQGCPLRSARNAGAVQTLCSLWLSALSPSKCRCSQRRLGRDLLAGSSYCRSWRSAAENT